MNYKLTKNSLKSKYYHIKASSFKGHIKLKVIYKYDKLNRFNFTALTAIRGNLSVFECKCVLIHVYKIAESFQPDYFENFKTYLERENYSKVFGSPWL